MGKREVRVVVVPKSVTFVLLVVTAAVMIALVDLLQGRVYTSEIHPMAEIFSRLGSGGLPPRHVLIAAVMPLLAHVLAFVPFGFLLFVLVDTSNRPIVRSYLVTLVAGIAFAAAVVAWQQLRPTRVTGPVDVVSNAAGTLGGAALGHLRKRVRIRFDH